MQGALTCTGRCPPGVRAACGARRREPGPRHRLPPPLSVACRPNQRRGRRRHSVPRRPCKLVTCLGGATGRQRLDCGRSGQVRPPDRTGTALVEWRSTGAAGTARSRDRNRGRGGGGRARRGRGRSHRRSRRSWSRRSWSRRRRRCDGRSGRRSRRRRDGRREEQQRIDVAVRILSAPNAEVDVWDVVRDLSARSDRADGRALAYRLAAPHACRTKMRQGDRIAVGCLDRHGLAADRHRAGERDGARRGRKDRLSRRSADVDSPVLACSVWIVAEDEFLQYGAFHGPGPRSRGRHDHEGRRKHDDQSSTHLFLLVVFFANRDHDTWGDHPLSIWTTGTCRKGACAATL